MLTQLTTVKTRLGLTDIDVKDDALLTSFINAFSAQAEHECRRIFGRTVNATHEFDAEECEIAPVCYPIESISKFELKTNETDGWVQQNDVDYLLRRNCVVWLSQPLATQRAQGRLTYTGGYVLPGTTPGAGQTALPADLEQAAIEQVACWYQNRDKLGRVRLWPHQGTYEQLAQLDLLPNVRSVLLRYERFNW
jgi:hypothetical protein